MPRHVVSVGASLPPPPRPEDAALPPPDWRRDYRRYFGGQCNFALLDIPKDAPLSHAGPPEKVLAAMKAPELCDYRGLPRGGGMQAVNRSAVTSPLPPDGASWRGHVGAVDLPRVLTDPQRKPEALLKLELFLEHRMGAAQVRAQFEADDKAEEEAKPLPQLDFDRIEHFRATLKEAAEAFPSLQQLLTVVTKEYDLVLHRLRAALEVSTRESLRTALEDYERQVRAMQRHIEQQDDVEKRLLAANRELQTAAAESIEREGELRRHAEELQKYLDQAGERLKEVEAEEHLRQQEQDRKGTSQGFSLARTRVPAATLVPSSRAAEEEYE
eukprot:Hpha_TRINITY_DN22245_c0_g1::TRINITY_DN22245_c0_g1_i1::g.167177::m.167177